MVWGDIRFGEKNAPRQGHVRVAVGASGEPARREEWPLHESGGRAALHCVQVLREADRSVCADAAVGRDATRTEMDEGLRTTGVVCFAYDAELDELTALRGLDARVAAAFSAGEYGALVRAVLAAGGRSGTVTTRLGRLWYARAPHGGDGAHRYVGMFFPADPQDESHLDTAGDLAYTGCCDEERRRLERYRLLGEDASVLTFDYDPRSDTLLYSVCPEDGMRVENTVRGYLANLAACRRIAPESREVCRTNLLRAMDRPVGGSFEYRADFFGEGYRWYRLRYVSVADEAGVVSRVVGRADEIENEMTDRAELLKSALTDAVTGLYNRRTVQRLIESALEEPSVSRLDALFMIDIDDFKRINDTLGHLRGDAVLLGVADAIRAVFRAEDIKGRFGGDEFIVYMRSFADPALPGAVARRLMDYLAAERAGVSCSVGFALVKEKSRFEDVFARADEALYQVKHVRKLSRAMGGE